MRLVQVVRLLLRHSVSRDDRELPICVQQLLADLELCHHDIEWQELYCFNIPDGVLQCRDVHGNRVMVAWIYMGELFRFVHFGTGQCIQKYRVTVTPFIWEPLFAEAKLVQHIERELKLDTELCDNSCRTFIVTRTVTSETTLLELRTSRSKQDSSLNPMCHTELRFYRLRQENEYQLHKKVSWNGPPKQKPRTEIEVVYDRDLKPFKTSKCHVDAFGDAEVDSYVTGSDVPIRTVIQMYDETHHYSDNSYRTTGLRRRAAKSPIVDVGVSRVYQVASA